MDITKEYNRNKTKITNFPYKTSATKEHSNDCETQETESLDTSIGTSQSDVINCNSYEESSQIDHNTPFKFSSVLQKPKNNFTSDISKILNRKTEKSVTTQSAFNDNVTGRTSSISTNVLTSATTAISTSSTASDLSNLPFNYPTSLHQCTNENTLLLNEMLTEKSVTPHSTSSDNTTIVTNVLSGTTSAVSKFSTASNLNNLLLICSSSTTNTTTTTASATPLYTPSCFNNILFNDLSMTCSKSKTTTTTTTNALPLNVSFNPNGAKSSEETFVVNDVGCDPLKSCAKFQPVLDSSIVKTLKKSFGVFPIVFYGPPKTNNTEITCEFHEREKQNFENNIAFRYHENAVEEKSKKDRLHAQTYESCSSHLSIGAPVNDYTFDVMTSTEQNVYARSKIDEKIMQVNRPSTQKRRGDNSASLLPLQRKEAMASLKSFKPSQMGQELQNDYINHKNTLHYRYPSNNNQLCDYSIQKVMNGFLNSNISLAQAKGAYLHDAYRDSSSLPTMISPMHANYFKPQLPTIKPGISSFKSFNFSLLNDSSGRPVVTNGLGNFRSYPTYTSVNRTIPMVSYTTATTKLNTFPKFQHNLISKVTVPFSQVSYLPTTASKLNLVHPQTSCNSSATFSSPKTQVHKRGPEIGSTVYEPLLKKVKIASGSISSMPFDETKPFLKQLNEKTEKNTIKAQQNQSLPSVKSIATVEVSSKKLHSIDKKQKLSQTLKPNFTNKRTGALVKFEDNVQLWIDKLRDITYLDDEPVKSWKLKKGTMVAAKYTDGLFYDAVVLSSYDGSSALKQDESSTKSSSKHADAKDQLASSGETTPRCVSEKSSNIASKTDMRTSAELTSSGRRSLRGLSKNKNQINESENEKTTSVNKADLSLTSRLSPCDSKTKDRKFNLKNKEKTSPKSINSAQTSPRRVSSQKKDSINSKYTEIPKIESTIDQSNKLSLSPLPRVHIKKLELNEDDDTWDSKLLDTECSPNRKEALKIKCPNCFLVFQSVSLFRKHQKTVCGSQGVLISDFKFDPGILVMVDERGIPPVVKSFKSKNSPASIPRGRDGKRCFRRGTLILHRWQTDDGSRWFSGKILRLLLTNKGARCEFEVEYEDDDQEGGPLCVCLYEDYPHDVRIVTR